MNFSFERSAQHGIVGLDVTVRACADGRRSAPQARTSAAFRWQSLAEFSLSFFVRRPSGREGNYFLGTTNNFVLRKVIWTPCQKARQGVPASIGLLA